MLQVRFRRRKRDPQSFQMLQVLLLVTSQEGRRIRKSHLEVLRSHILVLLQLVSQLPFLLHH